jgi:hypothetical protein
MGPLHQSQKGTVTLVALCLVAVLGITLASYIAVCSRAMNLSNRSFQTGLSQQLAEAGLEEALRAFNKNDWSDWSNGTATDWTLDTTNHRASCNVTFPASKFSQGVTGSLKIRVDNYDAAQLAATWSSTANYSINDLVGSGGVWYRCVQNGNLNKNPATQTDLAWWVPAPIPWAWSSNTNYTANSDIVCTGGIWYYCIGTHTSGSTFAVGSNWFAIPAPSFSWSSSISYTVNTVVFSSGTWYRAKYPSINSVPPSGDWSTLSPYNISWVWRSGVSYSFNDLVFYSTSGSGTWYRCVTPHTSAAGTTPTGANWENALTGSWAWSSTSAYNLNDVVYSGSSFYRCLFAHTNHAPPNATYWSNAPLYSTAWDSGRQYSQYDTVRYNGVWYLSRTNNNTGPTNNPATDTTDWIGANTTNASYTWNAASAYSAGVYRCYGGVWYICLAAHTGKSPNDTAYWTASWLNSSGVTFGAPVVYAEGTVNIVGSPSTKTQLRATIAPAPLFPNALAAGSTLSIGGGGTIDSFDSVTDPLAGSPGFSAVVAAGYTAGTAITISSTAVKGYLAAPSGSSSPYTPLFSSGGSVKGASSPGSPNIDLSRISRSPYIPQFDTLPSGGLAAAFSAANFPKGTALNISAATTDIGTPGAITPSRYYYNGNLALGAGASINTLHINGPVILYINGDLYLDGSPNGTININSTGSAEIHIAGSLKVNVGSDGINNTTQDPKKLIVISDTASSSVQNYSDNTALLPFYGVIYMPNTTNASGLVFNNNSTRLNGAVSAKKITYNGVGANVHYDTSLRYATFGGIDTPYVIMEWRELTAPVDKATMP